MQYDSISDSNYEMLLIIYIKLKTFN